MAKRLDARVAAISSAAVLAIYGAGYELTQRTVDVQRQIAAATRSVPRAHCATASTAVPGRVRTAT